MTTIVLVVIMLAALGGMIYCNKKQDVMPAAKVLAFLLMGVVVACGIYLVVSMGGSGSADSLRENEAKFYASQGYVVGKFIKDDLGGGKVVLIADENYDKDTRMPDFIEAVKSGMGAETVEVVTLDLPQPANQDQMMIEPISERMKAADFDKVAKAQSDAKVLVSLIGLPRDAVKMSLLRNAMGGKGPALVLLGYSEMPGMANAIKAGAIAGVVTVSPKAVFDEKAAPSNPEEAFAVRYVLVNKKNIAENESLFSR